MHFVPKWIARVAVMGALVACSDPNAKTTPPLSFVDKPNLEATPDENTTPCVPLETRKMRVEDPSLQAAFDLDTLGVLRVRAENHAMAQCLERAVRGGFDILDRNASEMTIFDPTRFEAFIDAAADRIDIDKVEGRWSEALQRPLPGVDGRRVNVEKTRQNFLDAVIHDAPSFAIAIDQMPALSSDLASLQDFVPSVLLGEYRTTFSRSKARTTNVKLAAAACDGVFLMPNAEFSYNAWVGERSEARGFKEAPVIEQGQLVEGLGGGACQVSSTIHAAALIAGLGIPERYNHSLPSSYIPVGVDAVVSYPLLDLRIQNTIERPVVLRVHTEDNVLIAQFFSDVPQRAKVMFRREIDEEIPFKEIITVDPKLPAGTVKIQKKGKVGYRVQRGRIFIEDGKERYEKLYADTYQSQTQQTSIAPDVVYPGEQ